MPAIVAPRLESLAETDPEIYEVLRNFQEQLNQVLPSLISGNGSPEATVPATAGTVYVQRDASAGPLSLHVKDGGEGLNGWATLGAFGSIPPTAGGGFQAVATPNSVTFYYDGTNGSQVLTMYRANGVQSQVAAGRTVVTGLAPNTTYYFYPYFDERTQSLKWVAGTMGNPAIAFTVDNSGASQQARLTHHIPLTPGTAIIVTTPAGGSSPAPVGGGFGGKGRFA